MAWPSAPERLRGFSSALKSVFLLLLSSRSSPPLAKATETRLSDIATASSSASPSFLDKAFSFLYWFVYLLSLLLLLIRLSRSEPLQSRSPFCLRSSSRPTSTDPHLPEAFD